MDKFYEMQPTVTIRFAEVTDLDNLVHLCKLHAIYEKCDYSSNSKKNQLQQHLFTNSPSLYCLVVPHEDTLIGYATYMKQFSTWDAEFYIYMDCLFITEESRGLGIGDCMMQRIKTETEKLGCKTIQWQTPEFNTGAIRFYDRIGGVSKTKERYFWQ